MLQINFKDIERMQSNSPKFTKFCNDLLHAIFSSKTEEKCIITNNKDTLPDGKIDAQITTSLQDDPTGYFKHKTVLQYKAQKKGNLNIPNEFKAKTTHDDLYVANCITDGYAYLLCLADTLPPMEISKREKQINECCKKLNSNAPPAYVLDANRLAKLANKYPAIVLNHFHLSMQGKVTSLETILKQLRSVTQKYIQPKNITSIQNALEQYIDFSTIPPSKNLFVLHGYAGVGKTRFVCEAIDVIQSAKTITIYIEDESHLNKIITQFAEEENTKAIIIADECSIETRNKLITKLRPLKNRIRVIAIDNQGYRPGSPEPEYEMKQISIHDLRNILKQNFPVIPSDLINLVAQCTGGFITLAADMCHHPYLIKITNYSDLTNFIDDYYQVRLNEKEKLVLESLSSITKIGYQGNCEKELGALCDILNLNLKESDFREIALKSHNQPGFIGKGGRYLYVTPEIIASKAFHYAYEKWVKNRIKTFVDKLPSDFLERFLERVAQSGTEKMRDEVKKFFLTWGENLKIDDLISEENCNRFVTLIEIHPDTYLPILRKKIDDTPNENIKKLDITLKHYGWSLRRRFIFMCEKLAAFKEYFHDAERILLKLALNETEINIANNATNQWIQLFSINLSGTEIPFNDRFEYLKKYILSDNKFEAMLGLRALEQVLNVNCSAVREPRRFVIGNRIVPVEWRVNTISELDECRKIAIKFVFDLADKKSNYKLRNLILNMVANHTRTLLAWDYFEQLEQTFKNITNNDDLLLSIHNGIQDYLKYDSVSANQEDYSYIEKIKTWDSSLKQLNVHALLVTTIGVDPWMNDNEKHKEQIKNIATRLYNDFNLLTSEISWLFSEKALSAYKLGYELGKKDIKERRLLDFLITTAYQHEYFNLTRGYLVAILENNNEVCDQINRHLDTQAQQYPETTVYLSLADYRKLKAVNRIFKLIEKKKLPIKFLHCLTFAGIPNNLSTQEQKKLFSICVNATKQEQQSAINILEDFLGAISVHKTTEQITLKFEQDHTINNIWRILEFIATYTTDENTNHVGCWWGEILEHLYDLDPKKAADITVTALMSEHYDLCDVAKELLYTKTPLYPEQILNELDRHIFDVPNHQWKFTSNDYKNIFVHIPEAIIKKWLQKRGLEGARLIASQIPSPYLTENNIPIVPNITDHVLAIYGDDEQVLHNFCMGRHRLQIYHGNHQGNIAELHRNEADIAKQFFNHANLNIRKWAQIESEGAEDIAKKYQQNYEEENI